jgi:hypothetical protein
MAGKFLIDLTDARFHVAGNEDVLEFVRRSNPFAHSDVGSLLLALGEGIPEARAYSPSFAQLAYVVLRTDAWQIFAIAFGQRGLAFRLSPESRDAALADGGVAAPDIGPAWVAFAPWGDRASRADGRARLQRWCTQAFADAAGG